MTLAVLVAAACSQGTTPAPTPASAEGRFEPQREEFLAVATRLAEGDNDIFGRAQLEPLRRTIEDPSSSPASRIETLASLTLGLARLGQFDQAAQTIETAIADAASSDTTRGFVGDLHRIRGMVYLRQAEVANCIDRHQAESCVFPLRDGGVHGLRAPALEAKRSFEAFLEQYPRDLKVRWLLNLVAMTLDEYPEGVPDAFLIPPSTFESEQDIGRFIDIAPQLGVNTFNLSGGCVVEDFDQDGLLDIVTTTSDPAGPARYYRNRGGGPFDDRSVASRLDDQLGGLNVIGADYDGDGDTDLLILRGAWLLDAGAIRKSLMRNDADGTFTDVTRAAGVADPAAPTQAAAWADYDNDGDLDLYVCNESRLPTGRGDFPSQLYLNRGDGTFADVARASGVTNDRYCKGVAAGDYDNDGDMDLYVSNIGPNRLYRNHGDATFTDVAVENGVTEPAKRSFATWFFDYDNDGWLDLWVGAFDATVEDVTAHYLGLPDKASRPRLYRNTGGSFSDVAAEVGLDRPLLPMGANFGDLDNDGWLDMYLGTGDPDYQTLMPNVMLRNDRGVRFTDVTTSGGFGHLQKGHGVAFADLDNDGDQDVYHQLGGFYPGDGYSNVLYMNPGHGNRFLVLELEGRRSNRGGIGARIRVTIEGPFGRREIYRAVGSVSSFGGSPARQEIGLGDAQRIVELAVDWPTSDLRQVFTDLALDGAFLVREGEEELRPLPYRAIQLP